MYGRDNVFVVPDMMDSIVIDAKTGISTIQSAIIVTAIFGERYLKFVITYPENAYVKKVMEESDVISASQLITTIQIASNAIVQLLAVCCSHVILLENVRVLTILLENNVLNAALDTMTIQNVFHVIVIHRDPMVFPAILRVNVVVTIILLEKHVENVKKDSIITLHVKNATATQQE